MSAKPFVRTLRGVRAASAVAGAREVNTRMVANLDGPAEVTSFVKNLNVKYEKVIDPPQTPLPQKTLPYARAS